MPLGQFDDEWMIEFRRRVGPQDETALAALRADLIEIGQRFRAIISSLPCDLPGAPFNKSLTKRTEWLNSKVLGPSKSLREALSEVNQPMFSSWPYENDVGQIPDWRQIRAGIESLERFAKWLQQSLQNQQSDDAGHNQEIRAEIFAAIAIAIRAHLPELKPSLGVYDQEENDYQGRYVATIRHIYWEITDLRKEKLVRLIRGEIAFPS